MSSDSMTPDIVILNFEEEMELIQDDTLLVVGQETPTVRELPFLYNLIAQEVEYPQNLQLMLAESKPEERAIMHAFFLKAATNRSKK